MNALAFHPLALTKILYNEGTPIARSDYGLFHSSHLIKPGFYAFAARMLHADGVLFTNRNKAKTERRWISKILKPRDLNDFEVKVRSLVEEGIFHSLGLVTVLHPYIQLKRRIE